MIAKGTVKGTPPTQNENPLGSPRGCEVREQDLSGVHKQKAPPERGAFAPRARLPSRSMSGGQAGLPSLHLRWRDEARPDQLPLVLSSDGKSMEPGKIAGNQCFFLGS
jgi:hypothetical protein